MVADFLRPADRQKNYLYKSNKRRKYPNIQMKKNHSLINPSNVEKREDNFANDDAQIKLNHAKNAISIKLE
jgi:hypothetical protein